MRQITVILNRDEDCTNELILLLARKYELAITLNGLDQVLIKGYDSIEDAEEGL